MPKKEKATKAGDHPALLKGIVIALFLLDGLIWAHRRLPNTVICAQEKWAAVDVIRSFTALNSSNCE